jgi:hypothetical protein
MARFASLVALSYDSRFPPPAWMIATIFVRGSTLRVRPLPGRF